MKKLLCFIAGITLLFGFGCGDEGDQSRLQPLTSNTVAPVPIAQDFQATPLALHILTSTTYITVTNSEESSDGSGFVCGAGLIATAFHIIDAVYNTKNLPTYVKVQSVLGVTLYPASSIVAHNSHKDIAIIRVPHYPAPSLPLASINEVFVGQDVLIVGNPLGMIGTVAKGNVSAIRNGTENWIRGADIQIAAPSSLGSSGSPVVNQQGKVIGIHVASVTGGNSMGLVVPSNAIKSLLDQIPAATPLGNH